MHNMQQLEQFFKESLASIGHPFSGDIKFDMGWQYYQCPGSKHSKTTARYSAHSDGAPTIVVWCGRCQVNQSFTYKVVKKEILTKYDIEKNLRKKDERERIEAQNRKKALEAMKKLWEDAKPCAMPCVIYPYFKMKQVTIASSSSKPYAIHNFNFRVTDDGTLLCPVCSIDGELISLQRIYWDHKRQNFEKRFFKGLSPKNGFLLFGVLAGEIYFAEGIATALTIHEATGKPVICVYGKNFDKLAPIIAKLHSSSKLFNFCADTSSINEPYSSEENANEAIDIVGGGTIYLPDFSIIPAQLEPAIPRSDFNDLFVLLLACGLSREKALLELHHQLTQKRTQLMIIKQIEHKVLENKEDLEVNDRQLIITVTPHSEILGSLTKKITPVNFRMLAEIAENEKLTSRHLQIITVEQVLSFATSNSWGMCKNHDFIYLYNGAFWSLIGIDELKTFLGCAAELMGADKFRAKHFHFREQLCKQFMALANLPKPEQPKDAIFINLKNGTFVITPEGNKLQRFNPNDFLTYQLPFDYNPEAKAPMFEEYLNKVLPDIQKQMILAEYLGSVFIRTSTLKLEKTLLLYGSGANGKSVFYEIIKNLLGEDNTSEYSLNSLTNDTGYYRAMIANKLVNYASELSGKMDPAIFKQLVSGEPVEARLPYGNPFIITQYAKFIFNCNELPKDVEQNEAYFRRFLIITFDVTIPESEQDKQLSNKIISNELSGIFNWVLNGLQRLLEQKRFTDCDAVRRANEQYKMESDSVRLFLDEKGYKPSATNPKKQNELFLEYKSFCIEDGYKPLNNIKFAKRLENIGFIIKRINTGKIVFVSKEISFV